MKIKIIGSAKEIADLIVALQGQPNVLEPPKTKVKIFFDGKELSDTIRGEKTQH